MEKRTVRAMVHSLQALAEVTIISKKDNNHVIAEYNGKRCTAVDNPYSGLFYVDDIYGVIPESMTDEDLRARGY